MRIILTGCGKSKAPYAVQAKHLYTSTLCHLRAEYAEAELAAAAEIAAHNEAMAEPDTNGNVEAYATQKGADVLWFILSAAYGVISPVAVIEPYEASASDFTHTERASWALQAATKMLETFAAAGGKLSDHSVEIHAGVDYAERLAGILRAAGVRVSWWSEGLQIGEQQEQYVNVRENRAHRGDTAARDAEEAARTEAANDRRETRRQANRSIGARVGGPFVVERQGQLFPVTV